jgi:hypothetical protein
MSDKLLSTDKKNLLTTEDVEFLFNELRKSSIIWDGRKEILRLSRKRVFVRTGKNGSPIYKFNWQCAACKKWKRNEDDMEVDHITEIGGVTGFTGDWNETIAKIFPRPVEKYLQCLCKVCHLRKTLQYNSARTKWQRKR